MGLLARVHSRSYTVPPMSLKDPELAKMLGVSARTSSGVVVTYELAMTYSAVYDAVNQIANDIAKMPLNHMKRRPEGGAEAFTTSRLYRMLKAQPNPEMGSMVLRRQIMVWALTSHGGFAEIQRDGTGFPVALWPIEPHRVRPYREKSANGTLGPLVYRIDNKTDIDDADMIAIAGIGYTPGCGYSLLDKARQAVGLALAAERFGAAFFANGLNFGGILSSAESDPDDEQKQEIRDILTKLHQGVENAHKFAVLWGGFKFEKTGVSPTEAQMNDLRDKQVEEVARFYRIPPHRLGLNKPGTVSYSSVEMANLDYYTGCLLDWVTLWEEELNRKLIPALEARQQFIKHNANVFLRGDIKSRYEALGIARDKGIINADEWRDLEEMPPQDNGQGRDYFMQTAQAPVRLLAPYIQSQIDLNDAKVKQAEQPPPPPMSQPATGDPSADPTALKQRAEAAERLADEWRSKAAALAEQASALDASGAASAGEVGRLSIELQTAQSTAASLTALSADLKRSADQALENAARADAAASEAQAARRDAESALALAVEESERAKSAEAAARADLAAAEARAAESAEALAERQAQADEASGARSAAEAKVAELEASIAVLNHDLLGEREQGEVRQREAEARLTALTSEREAALVEQAKAESQSAEARSLAEARIAELSSEMERWKAGASEIEERSATEKAALDLQIAALRSEREIALATVAEARAKQIEAEARLAEGTTRFAELREALTPLKVDLEALAEMRAKLELAEAQARSLSDQLNDAQRATKIAEAALSAAKQAEIDAKRAQDCATAEVISAHHALYVDVMRRMIERETDRARRHQITSEKFRAWFEGDFYADHADLCLRALLPAIQIHVAFLGSTLNAADEARRLVSAHIADSQRQLRTLLDGDADALAASLPALLAAWDRERPTALADRLMQREIDHVRSR